MLWMEQWESGWAFILNERSLATPRHLRQVRGDPLRSDVGHEDVGWAVLLCDFS